MAVNLKHMLRIAREGMDGYWRIVRSKTDEGLTEYELALKRQYEHDTKRLAAKYDWEALFSKEFK